MKKIIEMVEEKREEIKKAILEGYKEMEGYKNSMHIDITLDPETGEISTTAPLSQSWMGVEQWNGEVITVASVGGWDAESLLSDLGWGPEDEEYLEDEFEAWADEKIDQAIEYLEMAD